MRKLTRWYLMAVFACGVAALAGCGGSSGGVTTPSVVPAAVPAPVRTVVAQGAFSGLDAHYIADIPFSTTATGMIEAHVDWTFAEDHVVVYVAKGACSFDQLKANQCSLVASSETTTPKPRVLTIQSSPASNYVLWIGNIGPKAEAVSYQVFLTTGGSSAALSRGDPDLQAPQLVGDFVRGVSMR